MNDPQAWPVGRSTWQLAAVKHDTLRFAPGLRRQLASQTGASRRGMVLALVVGIVMTGLLLAWSVAARHRYQQDAERLQRQHAEEISALKAENAEDVMATTATTAALQSSALLEENLALRMEIDILTEENGALSEEVARIQRTEPDGQLSKEMFVLSLRNFMKQSGERPMDTCPASPLPIDADMG